MKAIQVSKVGGPEVLEFRERTGTTLGPGQVMIRVEAAGVNFIDTYHRTGLYDVPLPFTPGIEAAGTVMEVSSEVEEFGPGDRVAYCLALGSYTEIAVVDAAKLVPLPDAVSAEVGAAAMCQGMTAQYLTTDCYPLAQGNVALVHAAAGGVGLLLVQMAKRLGARVVGTVSTEEKAQLALKAGADLVVRYTEQDFQEEVTRFTDGQGVDVVYESVGKTTFLKSMKCLKPRGMMVLYGQSSGPVEPFDPQLLNQHGSLFLTRPTLFHYARDRRELLGRANDVLNMIARKEVTVKIGERLPLSEAAEAHRRLEARKTSGKIILVP